MRIKLYTKPIAACCQCPNSILDPNRRAGTSIFSCRADKDDDGVCRPLEPGKESIPAWCPLPDMKEG